MAEMNTSTIREPVVLALDVGTSSARTALYDAGGDALPGTLVAMPHTPSTTPDGGSELDPDALLDRVCELVDGTLGSAPGVRVAAVGTCTFWHSLMGTGQDGAALTPVYTWADTRSAGAILKLTSLLDPTALYERTGCPAHSSYLPEKLLWLRDTRPELFGRVRHWLSFGEYLHLKLLGERACAQAMASGTGLYDQVSSDWYAPVLEAIDVVPDTLSPLVPTSRPLGALRAEYGDRWPALSRAVWYPAVGDGACSNIGSGAAAPGVAGLNFGTSGAIRTVVPRPVRFSPGLWLYRLDERRLLLGGALSNAGNVYGWLLRTLGLSRERAEEALLNARPGGTGLRFLPYLAGERSPRWSPDATGAISGLRLDTSPTDILRAGMEGVMVEFMRVHNMLSSSSDGVKETVASGGAFARSEALRAMLADALGRPVRVCAEVEPSARGAALLALESLGAIPDVSDVRTDSSEPYTPDPERHAIYRSIDEQAASSGVVSGAKGWFEAG